MIPHLPPCDHDECPPSHCIKKRDKMSSLDRKKLLRLAQMAERQMEAFASTDELEEWHGLCEVVFGSAYPLRCDAASFEKDCPNCQRLEKELADLRHEALGGNYGASKYAQMQLQHDNLVAGIKHIVAECSNHWRSNSAQHLLDIEKMLRELADEMEKGKSTTGLGSIMDVQMICPRCQWTGTVGKCEPDVDGEGSLGCPSCLAVVMQVSDKGGQS